MVFSYSHAVTKTQGKVEIHFPTGMITSPTAYVTPTTRRRFLKEAA